MRSQRDSIVIGWSMFCSGFPGAGFTAPIRSRSIGKCYCYEVDGELSNWLSNMDVDERPPKGSTNISSKQFCTKWWLTGRVESMLYSWYAIGFNESFTSYARVLPSSLVVTVLCNNQCNLQSFYTSFRRWFNGIIYIVGFLELAPLGLNIKCRLCVLGSLRNPGIVTTHWQPLSVSSGEKWRACVDSNSARVCNYWRLLWDIGFLLAVIRQVFEFIRVYVVLSGLKRMEVRYQTS